MTDTTKPPNRPTSPRPRPSGRDESRHRDDRRDDRRDSLRDAPRDDGRGDRPRRFSPKLGPKAGPASGDRPRGGASLTRGAEPAPPKDDARIAKVMARAGLCSRRDAEGWIAAGRVAVNGVVIDSPALNVKPGDRITVDGEPLPERDQTRLYLFHKPRGLVTTARDPEGRPTIFDNLPDGLPRVVSVGRLDINTEGLMLLTNDGGLARVLELPATGWLRRYRVRANGEVDQARLDALKKGVTIDGIEYQGIEAVLDRVQGANVWLTMGLREGKNREIKRVLESLGLAVTRLIRVSFGPFQLGELVEGAVESVPPRVLREQLGPALAAQAGVDLEAREEVAPRRGSRAEDGSAALRPGRSIPAAPRPHVGALRAAREEEAGEGRKRTLRGATADRRGRTVAVERVVPVAKGAPRGDSRNARRFASESGDRDGYVAGRQKTRAEAGDARSSRGGFGARPGRDGFAARPERGTYGDRSDRGDRGDRGDAAGRAGESRASRGPRAGRFDPKTRGDRAEGFARRDDRPEADERPRGTGFAARPRTFRPVEGERGGRGERSGAFEGRGPRRDGNRDGDRDGNRGSGFAGADGPRPGRAFKRDGGGPRVERAGGFGGENRSGKPNGRPGGFSSERPATGRNKPKGGRPFGSKPQGKPPGRPSGKPPRGRP